MLDKTLKLKEIKKPFASTDAEYYHIKQGRKILAKIYSAPFQGDPCIELEIKGNVSYYGNMKDCIKSAQTKLLIN